ncbi:hypothetical protein KFE25_007240 [Diacronema lutheri]|uniref:Uncharacterized protein n=1 Tax=Diacronema lutheri TaxID=2081491 RepID=A0A8J6C7Z2_DIALT|nr:hypothetical protein KFE25_007240 [Diacronema lutheri]
MSTLDSPGACTPYCALATTGETITLASTPVEQSVGARAEHGALTGGDGDGGAAQAGATAAHASAHSFERPLEREELNAFWAAASVCLPGGPAGYGGALMHTPLWEVPTGALVSMPAVGGGAFALPPVFGAAPPYAPVGGGAQPPYAHPSPRAAPAGRVRRSHGIRKSRPEDRRPPAVPAAGGNAYDGGGRWVDGADGGAGGGVKGCDGTPPHAYAPPWGAHVAHGGFDARPCKPDHAKPDHAKPDHAKPDHAKPDHAHALHSPHAPPLPHFHSSETIAPEDALDDLFADADSLADGLLDAAGLTDLEMRQLLADGVLYG